MASKNSVKTYAENAFYHIYNRGVEKREIFLDNQDYSVFLSYLETYLSPKDEAKLQAIIQSATSTTKEKDKALKLLHLKNYFGKIELVCYALMPNHFHLLIHQKTNDINKFMNSLGTRYGMYFNRKYRRSGILFQDVYKAVLVSSDEQLLHLSRYIHLNPQRANSLSSPSSLADFANKRNTAWIKKDVVLDYFSKSNSKNSYEKFLGLGADSSAVASLGIDFQED